VIYPSPVAEAVVRLILRLPGDVHAALVAWAKDEERSLNAQIIYLLREAIRRSGRAS
jgi:hypothetical protein